MRIIVRRIHLDRNGYARRGEGKHHYYGVGQPVYSCDLEESPNKCPVANHECRASNVKEAREIAEHYFYRTGMLKSPNIPHLRFG